jgi:hypothetical protein
MRRRLAVPAYRLLMATFTVSRRDISDEALILDSLLVANQRPHVLALIEALQAASTPAHFYSLQRSLLQRFFVVQAVTAELAEDIVDTKRRLATLTRGEPLALDAIRRVQEVLARQELTARTCKAIMHALRCVGDGIAWKTLRYDRGTISVLGQGQRVGRLADATGLDAELGALAECWEEGRFAIHNDLTNCLRTGDLTLPFEPGPGIWEVKAGRSLRRSQFEEAQRRVTFLQAGQGMWGESGPTARLIRNPTRFRTHQLALRGLLATARADGYSVEQVCSSVLVVCVDPRVSRGDPGIDVITDKAIAEAGWQNEERIILTTTAVRRMRERRHHFPYLAPLTIFPLPAVDAADLLLGPLEYVTIVNALALERAFEAAGVTAEVITRKPAGSRVFLRAERGGADIEVSSLVGEQLLAELMDPACLVQAVTAALDRLAAGAPPGPSLMCFADEDRAWNPPS